MEVGSGSGQWAVGSSGWQLAVAVGSGMELEMDLTRWRKGAMTQGVMMMECTWRCENETQGCEGARRV